MYVSDKQDDFAILIQPLKAYSINTLCVFQLSNLFLTFNSFLYVKNTGGILPVTKI